MHFCIACGALVHTRRKNEDLFLSFLKWKVEGNNRNKREIQNYTRRMKEGKCGLGDWIKTASLRDDVFYVKGPQQQEPSIKGERK